MALASFEDRVKGILYGVALGDALGHPHEFRNSIPLKLYTGELIHTPRVFTRAGTKTGVIGQASDDTEMTLALLGSIIAEKSYDRNSVILAYEEWANSKPMGMGKNTNRLFKGVKTVQGYESRYKKYLNEDLTSTESNGTLMRATPLALLVDLEDPSSFDPVITDSKLSNPNETNRQAGLAYVTAVAMALDGASSGEIIEVLLENKNGLVPSLAQAITDAETGVKRNVSVNKGWVAHAFYAAVYALFLYRDTNVEEPFSTIINAIVRLGGDTDTNAAIAGGLLGALIGYTEMTHEDTTWENIRIIITADTSKGTNPRPIKYHPANIDQLVDSFIEV